MRQKEPLLDPYLDSNAPSPLTHPSHDQHLLIPVVIKLKTVFLSSQALVDSGASSSFIDAQYAALHDIPTITKPNPYSIEAIDGRELVSGAVTHETLPLLLCIGPHQEYLSLDVISCPNNPIILGVPWLKLHNPQVHWSKHDITFLPQHCRSHQVHVPTLVSLHASSPDILEDSTRSQHDDELDTTSLTPPSHLSASPHPLMENSVCPSPADLPQVPGTCGPTTTIPEPYQDLAEVFSKAKADVLPAHSSYDHAIDLEPGCKPPWGPIYNLSEPEQRELRNYLEENLSKGFIQHSQSPSGAPILFVKKKDGSLRLCVDYRGLNNVTKKNRYPLPLITSLLNQLRTATVFTKIDLRGAYNLVRIKAGDEWKTAFRTRYGLFEYLVMPFGLTNAPATFQHLMNNIFRDMLDVCVIIYLDDILVYSSSLSEHVQHVHSVLQRLLQHRLYAKLEKCQFHSPSIEFLGYVVAKSGVYMDPAKIKSIVSWPAPKSAHDIQIFLGFANFYRRFIKNYSQIAMPLTSLLKKDTKFVWSETANTAFQTLKSSFTTAPILAHADPSLPFVLETDASNFAIGAVLSQASPDATLHPVAFFSRKMSPAESNYEIYDKELLAIRMALEEWRHHLEGAQHKVLIYTDHKNLEYFTTTRHLTQRQIRWSQYLSRFNFQIVWRPGVTAGKPDALSRRTDYAPSEEGNGDNLHNQQILLKPHHFKAMASHTPEPSLHTQIRHSLADDGFAQQIIKQIQDASQTPSLTLNPKLQHFKFKNNLLWYKHCLYVPDDTSIKLLILKNRHDSPAAGHFGQNKTLNLVKRNFWWPGMKDFINTYVSTCDICNRAKVPHHKPHGLLQPLPIPAQCWTSISMDFIVELPASNNFNSILVVVDRLTKMAHFIPCTSSISAPETANLFLSNVFRLHGMPKDIVSDRGPQFVSQFWKHFFKLMQVNINLSSAYHPQSDGQTERVNQVLEQYLRCFINYQQDNWVDLLPLAEFSYNNSVHSSTGQTPFFANYGFHPEFEPTPIMDSQVPAAQNRGALLLQARNQLIQHLAEAQQSYKEYADRHRKTHPDLQPGDKVWILKHNIKTKRPSNKLDHRRLGPFKVIKQVNPVAYELDLPETLKIHPVFHVSLLEPSKPQSIPGRVLPPPPQIELEGQEEYEVTQILDSRFHHGQLQYLVDWKGYGPSDQTWQTKDQVKNCADLVKAFHRKYPDKPKPATRGCSKRGG